MVKMSSFKDSEFQDFSVEMAWAFFQKERNASHRRGGVTDIPRPP